MRLVISTQTRNTIILSAVSAILCGLVISPRVGDLNIFVPGAIFGLLFALANSFHRRSPLTAFASVAGYTVGSVVAYLGAEAAFIAGAFDQDYTGSSGPGSPNRILLSGFFGGLSGAFVLVLLTIIVSRAPTRVLDALRTIVIGGVAGAIFMSLAYYGKWGFVPMMFALAIWQIAVGWSLTTSIQTTPIIPEGSSGGTPS